MIQRRIKRQLCSWVFRFRTKHIVFTKYNKLRVCFWIECLIFTLILWFKLTVHYRPKLISSLLPYLKINFLSQFKFRISNIKTLNLQRIASKIRYRAFSQIRNSFCVKQKINNILLMTSHKLFNVKSVVQKCLNVVWIITRNGAKGTIIQ